jgi:BirA family biotin operon repressor/biotin-[acetyl-CoA-carboxylase] ligase
MQKLNVLRLLTDGKRHSGEALAKQLGITRSAVWKHVSRLNQWGLKIDSKRGSGYRLSRPIDPLNQEMILAALNRSVAQKVVSLEVFPELDSTNHHLLASPPPPSGALSVCLAEFQRAGRGRRGRLWSAPFGSGVCLSAGWCFDEMPRDLAALPLAIGVITRGVIHSMSDRWLSLKWPNDLVWDDRKLGGILVEVSAECQGRCYVVIGIGVNVSMGSDWLKVVSDWPSGATDLCQMTEGNPPLRNAFVCRMLEELVTLLSSYSSGGFKDYHAEFGSANYLQGREVAVLDGQRSFVGIVDTIDSDGALILQTETGGRRIISGDVSLRLT